MVQQGKEEEDGVYSELRADIQGTAITGGHVVS
jgi:hypothetical protein